MRKSVCFCLLICMLSVLGRMRRHRALRRVRLRWTKKGKITDTIVEEFDKDFYDSEELQSER
ncbi:MAG: hypothetical protein V8Q40_04855 [Anaerosacchariphilus sp.]